MVAARWQAPQRLMEARIRIPPARDERWLVVHPEGPEVSPLGDTFQLSLRTADQQETPLTVGARICWNSPDHVPAIMEPTRIPSGAGSALLSWLALLMDRSGHHRVRYRGPYPTPQLFTSLLECFEPRSPASAPEALAAFRDQDPETVAFAAQAVEPPVDFQPRPCERRLDQHHDVVAQLRGEPGNPGSLQRVFVGTTSFEAPDLGGLPRHGERRLRYHAITQQVTAEVWLLGQPWRTAALLDGRGRVEGLGSQRAAPAVIGSSRMTAQWAPVLAGLLARRAPRALAPVVADTLRRGVQMSWGETGDARCAWDDPGNMAEALETGETPSLRIHSALAGRATAEEPDPARRRTRMQQLVSEVVLGLEPLIMRVAAARLARRGAADPNVPTPAEAGTDLAATTARLIHDLEQGRELPKVAADVAPPPDGLHLGP